MSADDLEALFDKVAAERAAQEAAAAESTVPSGSTQPENDEQAAVSVEADSKWEAMAATDKEEETPATVAPAAGAEDEEDLEALFDQVAAERAAQEEEAPAAVAPAAGAEDEEDLEALFDQVATERAAQEEETAAAVAPAAGAGGEEDLEALFDQIAAEYVPPQTTSESTEVADDEAPAPQEVFHRIGALTRNLHNALRELGYDKTVEDAVSSLPDARDRLSYIADLTGKAAERSLSAVEQGQEYQDAITAQAQLLAQEWDRVFEGTMPVEEFKQTAVETRAFLRNLPEQTGQTKAQFTEIMMAQDFHDLTGQVIQRVVKVAQNLESQLVKLLIETTPPDKRPATESEWLTGPVVSAEGRDDVVTSQQQVDDLLESLGF